MQAPEIPQNESDRLATLRSLRILDTPPDDRFDRYARISARIFDVPIAVVSLVDRYRQWFKSAEGLDAKETPRDISFCGHAILGDDIFEIQNARRDPRFRDNPLVTDQPNIRFYAGAPLTAPNGHKLGTLCIIDKVPRRLNDEQKTMLQNLADMVVKEMIEHVDTESSLPNRNSFLLSGAKCFDKPREERQFSVLLFDIHEAVAAQNDSQSSASPNEKFAELLKKYFPKAQSIANIDNKYFCVLLKDSLGDTQSKIVQRLSAEAKKSLFAESNDSKCVRYIGFVDYDAAKHISIDEVLNDTDKMFQERDKQDQEDEEHAVTEGSKGVLDKILGWRKSVF